MESEIRNIVRETIATLLEEDSGYATTDLSGVGGGDVTGSTVTDPSYMHRPKIGAVQQRPYPSLIGMGNGKKIRGLKKLKLASNT